MRKSKAGLLVLAGVVAAMSPEGAQAFDLRASLQEQIANGSLKSRVTDPSRYAEEDTSGSTGSSSSGTDTSGLVDKRLITDDDQSTGGDTSSSGSSSTGSSTGDASSSTGDASDSLSFHQQVIQGGIDWSALIGGQSSQGTMTGDMSSSSGDASDSLSFHQQVIQGGTDWSVQIGDLSSRDALSRAGSDMADYIHVLASSDSARANAQAAQQRRLDDINRLNNDPYATIITVRASDFAVSDDMARWKIFLSDEGKKDMSQTIHVKESVQSESYAASSRTSGGSVLNTEGDLVGAVQVTTSRAKTNASGDSTVDVTVKVTDLNGKTKTGTVKKVSLSEGSAAPLSVDGWGDVELVLEDGGFVGVVGENAMVSSTVGGVLPFEKAVFHIDYSSGFDGLDGIVPILLPYEEAFACAANGKWKFAAASKVKVSRGADGTYELMIEQSRGRTNVSGLKLTYTPKTGVFKGSFKIYCVKGDSAKPKLTTKTAKVTGLVVGGIGSGEVTVSGTGISWPVTIDAGQAE